MNQLESIRQELLQYKQKINQTIIKDYTKQLPLTKTTHFKNEILSFGDLVERCDFDGERERDEIFKQMFQLRQEIGMFRSKLKSFEKSQTYLQQVSDMSENIKNYQEKFKDKMILLFDSLAQEENTLSHDLDIMDSKVEGYLQQPERNYTKPVLNQQKSKVPDDETKENIYPAKQSNKQKEIEEYHTRIQRLDERIILNGGKTCGWDKEEHDLFLKIRTRHHGKFQTQYFLTDCVKNIALHTEEEIIDHIEKFKKYLELEETKKDCVQQYKQLKEEIKKDLVGQTEIQEQIQKQKVKVKSKEEMDDERQKQKDAVKQWKMKRISSKMVEDDVKDEEKKEMDTKRWQRQQEEREQQRILVQQYKEQKMLQEQREKESQQYQQTLKRNISQDVKSRIREREEQMTEKRRMIVEMEKQQKLMQEYENERKQELKQVKYAYVQPKLQETTKAVEQQKREKFNPHVDKGKYADTFGGNLLGAGRRAVPTWRQGQF